MENTLGGLLRSREFPRWLMASALDVLIQDASANLTELPAAGANSPTRTATSS